MSNNIPFSLLSHQVPPMPSSTRWADILRWMVIVMDPDDSRLSFIASLLSHSLKYGGLSEKQSAAATKIYDRIVEAFEDGILVCQNSVGKTEGHSDRTIN